MSEDNLVLELGLAAHNIYLATDAPIAADISSMLRSAIELIETQQEQLKMLLALEQIVRDGADEIIWEPCDCGCPGQKSPRSKTANHLLRMLAVLDHDREKDAN